MNKLERQIYMYQILATASHSGWQLAIATCDTDEEIEATKNLFVIQSQYRHKLKLLKEQL